MILVFVGYAALVAKFGFPGLVAVLLHVALLYAPMLKARK